MLGSPAARYCRTFCPSGSGRSGRLHGDVPPAEHRRDVVDVAEELDAVLDAELGGANPKLVFERLVAEGRAAGQLEPLVAVGERLGEGLEQQQLPLPGIDPGEHPDPQRSARRLGAGACTSRRRPEALGITAVTASARRNGRAESRVACEFATTPSARGSATRDIIANPKRPRESASTKSRRWTTNGTRDDRAASAPYAADRAVFASMTSAVRKPGSIRVATVWTAS